MNNIQKNCYICGTHNSKFHNLNADDNDGITYMFKLKSCISTELVILDTMELCSLCLRHLRAAYKFRESVLASQQRLRDKEDCVTNNIKDIENNDVTTEHIIKSEPSDSESDVEDKTLCKVKEEISTDDLDSKDILQTVNALSKKIQEERKKRQQRTPRTPLILNCQHCGLSFDKRWTLKRHEARVHSNVRKFICKYCHKEFKQKCHLNEHIPSHTGEKKYACPICDQKFLRMSSQKRHIRAHGAPPGAKSKRTPFLCTICGKSFPFSNGVQRHMRIHLGIKNYECSICKRKFSQSTHLHVHMRTHTGEKPYICDMCGEKFSLKTCLLRHINSRHSGSGNDYLEIPIVFSGSLLPLE